MIISPLGFFFFLFLSLPSFSFSLSLSLRIDRPLFRKNLIIAINWRESLSFYPVAGWWLGGAWVVPGWCRRVALGGG